MEATTEHGRPPEKCASRLELPSTANQVLSVPGYSGPPVSTCGPGWSGEEGLGSATGLCRRLLTAASTAILHVKDLLGLLSPTVLGAPDYSSGKTHLSRQIFRSSSPPCAVAHPVTHENGTASLTAETLRTREAALRELWLPFPVGASWTSTCRALQVPHGTKGLSKTHPPEMAREGFPPWPASRATRSPAIPLYSQYFSAHPPRLGGLKLVLFSEQFGHVCPPIYGHAAAPWRRTHRPHRLSGTARTCRYRGWRIRGSQRPSCCVGWRRSTAALRVEESWNRVHREIVRRCGRLRDETRASRVHFTPISLRRV
jgi:hypothetical protein